MSNPNLATAGRHLENVAQLNLLMEEDGVSGNEHLKAMWAGQSNVLVATRVRPLMKHDVIKKGCVRVLDAKIVVIMDPSLGDKQDILRANRNREKQYAFDYVFEPGSSQEAVYHHTTKFLIHGVLDGYNATVFAYGQTGSGKTHTMIGTTSEPGIMVRVMGDLFVHTSSQANKDGVQYKVIVSFLEVYNENIRDLLSDVDEYLDLREDPIKGPVVAGITEVEAKSSEEIMNLLHQGNAKRSQAATAANEVSSRSHAVLQVVVECKDRAPGIVANIKVGKLSLIDLAGSERAANTKNTGARLVEGANINRSLLALGNCINALGEKGSKGNFVPYRDSKLTRLLKDSLGGNCRTVMIANISSAESSFEETLNTLKYANRAKNIKTNAQRNVLNVNYHISEYVQLINNLRSEINNLKDQLKVQQPSPSVGGGGGVGLGRHMMAGGGGGSSLSSVGNNISANSSTGQSFSGDGISNISISSVSSYHHPLPSPSAGLRHPTTPLQVLRESMKSASLSGIGGEGRELVNQMREKIVDNFQERMQLRRSLIELEDHNVQNSIEVSKRQLIVVQWSEGRTSGSPTKKTLQQAKADFSADVIANAPGDIKEAWSECEQLRKAIMKNNAMKKNIAKRLRYNEKEAEKFRDEMSNKVTGEDRRELMELQYQVGRLELENMELEQHRIVHESILKGKDLVIQKLRLQLAVRDKIIQRQQMVLRENELDQKVGYHQLALMEQTLMGDAEFANTGALPPPSPPRNMMDMQNRGIANSSYMQSPNPPKSHQSYSSTPVTINESSSTANTTAVSSIHDDSSFHHPISSHVRGVQRDPYNDNYDTSDVRSDYSDTSVEEKSPFRIKHQQQQHRNNAGGGVGNMMGGFGKLPSSPIDTSGNSGIPPHQHPNDDDGNAGVGRKGRHYRFSHEADEFGANDVNKQHDDNRNGGKQPLRPTQQPSTNNRKYASFEALPERGSGIDESNNDDGAGPTQRGKAKRNSQVSMPNDKLEPLPIQLQVRSNGAKYGIMDDAIDEFPSSQSSKPLTKHALIHPLPNGNVNLHDKFSGGGIRSGAMGSNISAAAGMNNHFGLAGNGMAPPSGIQRFGANKDNGSGAKWLGGGNNSNSNSNLGPADGNVGVAAGVRGPLQGRGESMVDYPDFVIEDPSEMYVGAGEAVTKASRNAVLSKLKAKGSNPSAVGGAIVANSDFGVVGAAPGAAGLQPAGVALMGGGGGRPAMVGKGKAVSNRPVKPPNTKLSLGAIGSNSESGMNGDEGSAGGLSGQGSEPSLHIAGRNRSLPDLSKKGNSPRVDIK